MSKPCPYCQVEFVWHFARHTTYAAKDGVNRFTVEPRCRHIASFAQNVGVIEDSLRSLWNARWDQEAERLFEEYTRHWKEENRQAFRARIFPQVHPIVDESYASNAPWRERHG